MTGTVQTIKDAEFIAKVQPALEQQDWQLLIKTIRANWTPDQILHLIEHGSCDSKKVAALAIGLVGKSCCIAPLAKLLHDRDEMVIEMAEHALWQIWFRGGSEETNRLVARGAEALNMHDLDRAVEHLDRAIELSPDFAEAYNQRAIAHYLNEEHNQSIPACKKVIELNPFHFGAWAGMGHCYLAMGELPEALGAYENALRINPNLHCVAELVAEIRERVHQ